MNNLVYTDMCSELNKKRIKEELGLEVIQGIEPKLWNLNDSLSIIMLPNIILAVINIINEISVIEMGLLYFMCKPILVTAPTIKDYPILNTKIASYVNTRCDLRLEQTSFIDWYKSWEK